MVFDIAQAGPTFFFVMFLFTPLQLLFVISVLTSGQTKLFLGVLGRTAWQNTRNKKAGESTRKRSVQPSSLLGLWFFLIFLFQDSFPVSRVMLPQGIFFGRNQGCFYCIQVSLHLPWDLTWYPTPLSSQRRRSSPSPSRGRRGRPWSAGNSTPWRRRSKRTPLSSSSRTLPHRSLLTVASWSSQPPHHQL